MPPAIVEGPATDTQHQPSTATGIRLAELMAALSIATDLGMGQPLEFTLSSCVLAFRLGESLKLGESDLRDIYYEALLRYIGGNAETRLLAAITGDELAFRGDYAAVAPGRTAVRPDPVVGCMTRK